MRQHTLPTGVIVELPELATDIALSTDKLSLTYNIGARGYIIDLPQSNYTHAKLLKNVSEEDASGIVCSIDELTGTPDTTFRAILKNHIRHLGYKNAAVVFKEKQNDENTTDTD